MPHSLSRQELQALKSQVSLMALMERNGVRTVQQGSVYKAFCPFHEAQADQGPTMALSRKNGLWVYHCHVCRKSGDAATFLRDLKKLSPAEVALELQRFLNGEGLPKEAARVATSRAEVDELKARVDLVDLMESSGLKLRQVGKSWMARCPFHPDETASLSVNREERLWQCFGCKAGGDALSFLQLKEGLEFPEALRRLREWLGQPHPAPPLPLPEKPARAVSGPSQLELMERIATLYHQRLWESEAAQEYLKSRGLVDRDLWQAFRIGYCDGSLREKLPTEGPVFETLQALGVLNAEGKEHFRGCLVVPLSHPDRGVVGFYGRRLNPTAATSHLYLPGPKQGVLNWTALKASSRVVITESVLDALSLWQAGVREVTCLHGVAGLPADLRELLGHFKTREAVLALDGDRAGREGALRAREQLETLGLVVQDVELPKEKDPNDLLKELGPTRLVEWFEAALCPHPSEKPRSEAFGQGFLLELGDVRYEVKMLPPFSSRLRVKLHGQRGEHEFLDKLDLYLQGSRNKAAAGLCKALRLQRFEAENHLKLVLEQAESWLQGQHSQADDAKKLKAGPTMTESEREETLELLRSPDLVERILQDMEQLGQVGEENAKLLVYLVGLSRKLPKPLSAVIISSSGVGKSSLTDMIELLTPEDEVTNFTRLTGQVLYYFPTALSHTLLILEERVGAEAADYSIRVLQSKRKLKQAVTVKDPITGQFKAQFVEVEGPIAYLETTTNPKLNFENSTRSFEINLDESESQTQRIQAAQRRSRLPVNYNRELRQRQIQQRHHNLQRLLEPVQISIPYAEAITFPSHRLRTRRDHERFLCLIEASAFLHQHQRERGRTEDGMAYVLASLEDYRIAYELAQSVLASTLNELSHVSQDLWGKIRDWVHSQEECEPLVFHFSRRELREHTGLEDHRLRDALAELTEMEYIEAIAGNGGKQFRYRLVVHSKQGGRLPILSPEELAAKIG